jgi:hypothetical protein
VRGGGEGLEVEKELVAEVTERRNPKRTHARASVGLRVDVYMIRTPRLQTTLFLSSHSLEMCAQTEVDKFRRFIRRMMRHRYGVIRWVGRVTRGAHRYYQKLEDRIDPLERMIKALNCPTSLRVLHAPNIDARAQFRDLLRAQRLKHTAWLVVDGVITAIAVMFFWVLVPIPGPNVFFYYPALRLLSHYRAMVAARRVLNHSEVSFGPLPELASVEEDLRNPALRTEAGFRAGIDGLDRFLERVV